MSHQHNQNREGEEIKILRDIDQTEHKILGRLEPRLSFIKISHGENNMLGAFKLTIGGKSIERVLGFDQFGALFAIDFTANPVVWSIDDPTTATSTPETDPSVDDVVGVKAGTVNLTATCAGFTDTETGTVAAEAPRLASIKIDSTPA